MVVRIGLHKYFHRVLEITFSFKKKGEKKENRTERKNVYIPACMACFLLGGGGGGGSRLKI